MLTFSDKHRIFLGVQPIDFRSRLDGTLSICRNQWQLDPSSGHVFVFRNRKTTIIRCIFYDKGGFWLLEKRISKGCFNYWPKNTYEICELTATQLMQLLNDQPPLF